MKFSELFDQVASCSEEMGEKSDCAVKAIAIAAGVSYKEAHRVCELEGRKPRRSTPVVIIFEAMRDFNFRGMNVTGYFRSRTVKSLEVELKRQVFAGKTFLVLTRGGRHILCAKDGVVHDWSQSRLHRIKWIIEVVSEDDFEF